MYITLEHERPVISSIDNPIQVKSFWSMGITAKQLCTVQKGACFEKKHTHNSIRLASLNYAIRANNQYAEINLPKQQNTIATLVCQYR